MAAMRLNIPAIFVSGGPMEAGKTKLSEHKLDLVDAMVIAATAQPLTNWWMSMNEVPALPVVPVPGCLRQTHELPHRGHWSFTARQRHHPGDSR